MNRNTHVSLWYSVFKSLGNTPRRGIDGSEEISVFNFLISTVFVIVYSTTNNNAGFLFPNSLPVLDISLFNRYLIRKTLKKLV